GWLNVLKMVPWAAVIANAPKVADSAKKLWNGVAKKSVTTRHGESMPVTLGDLQVRLLAAESTIAELHAQMLTSSELIKTLADQNAQLVSRVEINRVRLLCLAAVTLALLIALVTMAFKA
ncbi:MAG TPA: hypothetical protein VL381_03550, partial [Rhodocyclaceae bacterium]|nr:hypothetical protein [Rhodocyclaceae bacterium]